MSEYLSEVPSYDDARVEGGINIYNALIKADRSKPEVGDSPVPSEEGIKRYTRFLKSYSVELVDDEDLLAEAA